MNLCQEELWQLTIKKKQQKKTQHGVPHKLDGECVREIYYSTSTEREVDQGCFCEVCIKNIKKEKRKSWTGIAGLSTA